jgi:hypothetical protein
LLIIVVGILEHGEGKCSRGLQEAILRGVFHIWATGAQEDAEKEKGKKRKKEERHAAFE